MSVPDKVYPTTILTGSAGWTIQLLMGIPNPLEWLGAEDVILVFCSKDFSVVGVDVSFGGLC